MTQGRLSRPVRILPRTELHHPDLSPGGNSFLSRLRGERTRRERGRAKRKLDGLTSSACFPPSYRTINTLTFSRSLVSIRIDVKCPDVGLCLAGRSSRSRRVGDAVLGRDLSDAAAAAAP
jgi:hypothetical protein